MHFRKTRLASADQGATPSRACRSSGSRASWPHRRGRARPWSSTSLAVDGPATWPRDPAAAWASAAYPGREDVLLGSGLLPGLPGRGCRDRRLPGGPWARRAVAAHARARPALRAPFLYRRQRPDGLPRRGHICGGKTSQTTGHSLVRCTRSRCPRRPMARGSLVRSSKASTATTAWPPTAAVALRPCTSAATRASLRSACRHRAARRGASSGSSIAHQRVCLRRPRR